MNTIEIQKVKVVTAIQKTAKSICASISISTHLYLYIHIYISLSKSIKGCQVKTSRGVAYREFPLATSGTLSRSPCNEDHSILGSMFGPPVHGNTHLEMKGMDWGRRSAIGGYLPGSFSKSIPTREGPSNI